MYVGEAQISTEIRHHSFTQAVPSLLPPSASTTRESFGDPPNGEYGLIWFTEVPWMAGAEQIA